MCSLNLFRLYSAHSFKRKPFFVRIASWGIPENTNLPSSRSKIYPARNENKPQEQTWIPEIRKWIDHARYPADGAMCTTTHLYMYAKPALLRLRQTRYLWRLVRGHEWFKAWQREHRRRMRNSHPQVPYRQTLSEREARVGPILSGKMSGDSNHWSLIETLSMIASFAGLAFLIPH